MDIDADKIHNEIIGISYAYRVNLNDVNRGVILQLIH